MKPEVSQKIKIPLKRFKFCYAPPISPIPKIFGNPVIKNLLQISAHKSHSEKLNQVQTQMHFFQQPF
jgi:hypothetical protein